MGGGSSKGKLQELEDQQKDLMKANAELAKRLADQEAAHKRQQQETIEQVAKLIVLLAQAGGQETVIRSENREIEIDGTNYQIMQFVDRGGFGQVYKAKVKNTDKIVALKVMDNAPGMLEEIQHEIQFLRVVKKLRIKNHPIIDFFGSKVTKEGIYIAMELAACDLASFWVSKINSGTQEELAIYGMIIIVYVLRALAFLERLNIIHGDIKPQNLVIVPTESNFCIKLIDFGTVEKMQTHRAQMTVDATKAFTLFFVSPEFLRRNSKNIIARRLHKKSDVWAAGVMFYVLFCGRLPWKDQQDYENFCNDPTAKDVAVPDIGGYKTIIELLLKKDPEQRTSAKATLMQLKAHPVFGTIVEALDQQFCPVDDVCTMDVPSNIRQELLELRRPGHGASSASSNSSSTIVGPRRACRFVPNCTKKDPDHRREFAHPGDKDYKETATTVSNNDDSDKPPCRYGADCFRTDQDHLDKFSHPTKRKSPGSLAGVKHDKPLCRYGSGCYNNDDEHRRQFSHPSGGSSGGATGGAAAKPKCRFGDDCTKRKDREHMKMFLHDD